MSLFQRSQEKTELVVFCQKYLNIFFFTVYEVFENVAKTYDKMNDAMSCGVHRLWKDYYMEQISPTHGTKLIDVAGGTGIITFHHYSTAYIQVRFLFKVNYQ